MRTLQWRGWKARTRAKSETSRVENRKGIYKVWEGRELPSGVRDRAPTENLFGYSTALSIVVAKFC